MMQGACMNIKALLFDFDGTLVNSEALHYMSWLKVLAPFGISYSEHAFCEEFSGVPTLHSAEVLKIRHNLTQSASSLADAKNRYFVDTAATTIPSLMPFAQEVLLLASREFQLALVTGSTRAEALPVLQHYDLLKYFIVVVCKDDIEHPKPHPEPYMRALSSIEITSKQAVAIEDTHTGLCSARAAGVHTILVPNTHSKDQQRTGAGFVAQDLKSAWLHITQLVQS
jgi:HAD superfamily hydrolase (TIGR01509 family)